MSDDWAEIRHVNLSGEMYARLVFGEDDAAEQNYLQVKLFESADHPRRLFSAPSLLDPRFRVFDRRRSYIYIVSLWGDVQVRTSVLKELSTLKRKHPNIKIVGYWADPAFDLGVYDGCEFDLLVQSVVEQAEAWEKKGVRTVHVPVASLGAEASHEITHDAFSIGNATDLRLARVLNSERQFHLHGIDCFWCVARPETFASQAQRITEVQAYREFPDRLSMPPEDTVDMCCHVNVLLNISRLPNSYQTNPSYYAIMFNKKLIIDSEKIRENTYFDPRYMKIVDFSDPEWLTAELAEWMKTVEPIDYGYRGEWEPRVFYRAIRSMLKETKQ